MRLGGDRDDGIAAHERREDPRDEAGGARTATTPVGSGTVKLKYGPATGFEPPSTSDSLSAQPAYQTTRSTAELTSASLPVNSANRALRLSIISASR